MTGKLITAFTDATAVTSDDRFLGLDGGSTKHHTPNAVGKYVAGRLGVYNVLDYGAVGDGTTDDTAAIQAAIDAAPAKSVVHFPPGNYKHTSVITVSKSLTLRGSGQYTCALIAVACDGISVSTGVTYVRMESLELAAAVRHTVTPNTLVGLRIQGTTGSRPTAHIYRDVYIDGFATGILTSYLWSSTFINCRTNYGKIGLSVYGLSVNNMVTDCSFITGGGASSVGIKFNGTETGGAESPTEGWFISSTLIDSCEFGVFLTATTHCKIVSCIIDHNTGYGVYIVGGATNFAGNCEIVGNYIGMSGTATAAIGLANAISNAQNAGNRIIGNHALVYSGSTCSRGIHASGAQTKNNIIQGNTLRGFTTNDIRCDAVDNIITENVCLTASITNIYSTVSQRIANNVGTVHYARSKTLTHIGMMTVSYDEAVPTTGSWTAGDIVWKINPVEAGAASSKYIVQGWRRVTTGSGNVLNTDWFEMRMLTGN